jgi:arylsulfatase A-like enzyme
MISRVDDQLARLLDALDRSGHADRTVTFFFTDHGEYLGDYGLVEKWPSGLDEVLVRNPLIVHDPTSAHGVAPSFVELVDLTATLEDFADLTPGMHFGRSFRPLLGDPGAVHRDAAFSEGGFLLREEPWLERGDEGQYRHKQQLQHERPELVGRAIAVRTDEWCYIERLYEGPELYDRRADRRETKNLACAPECSVVELQLRDRIFRWLFETSDIVSARRDPRFDEDLQRAIFGS